MAFIVSDVLELKANKLSTEAKVPSVRVKVNLSVVFAFNKAAFSAEAVPAVTTAVTTPAVSFAIAFTSVALAVSLKVVA